VSRGNGRTAPELLAAVDLGSNSFHMVVARYIHGQLTVIDRLRESVRLGSGLDEEGRLDRDVAARALACLERFGQRLREIHPDRLRVVGTNTLRRAHRKQAFLEKARAALGAPIEIVSGVEEARLIYSGVANTSPMGEGRRLVVDIGGGSTELIIGESLTPMRLASTELGCVTMSERFFAGGRISGKRFLRARVMARGELEPIEQAYRKTGWQAAIGSSGTVKSVADAVRELDPAAQSITAEALEAVLDTTLKAEHVRDVPFKSLSEDRRMVFAGGLAILSEVFASLGIKKMDVSDGAMRDGLLYDLVGRMTHEDARDRTVRAMQGRYHVDTAQAERVEATALNFLEQVADSWQLEDPVANQLLAWAARLHEIGLDVSHSRYHQHGAYLLENADMPGFPREEQRLLARLVGGHRRKLSLEGVDKLLPPWDRRVLHLIVLLRLAVLLHRGRGRAPLPELTLIARGRNMLEARFPVRWLRDHPLTVADLSQEIDLLKAVDFRLRVYSSRGLPAV
jgi:exopolyphosphatase/guanosine-5'-triphosphate,3'-diphosphate pyrophosphatase